jgi:hypothetical protein
MVDKLIKLTRIGKYRHNNNNKGLMLRGALMFLVYVNMLYFDIKRVYLVLYKTNLGIFN